MALIDITPQMTSNTTPSPYVVSASSQDNSSNWPNGKAFHAFVAGKYWMAQETGIPYLTIDFGDKTKVSQFNLGTSYGIPTTKSIRLCGSNDNIEFVEIFKTNLEWQAVETKEFNLNKVHVYRYYRFYLSEMNFGESNGLSGIKFLIDDTLPLAIPPKITIHKTLKEQLPKTITSEDTELHFTEDGGIHISRLDGSLIQCNTNGTVKTEVIFEGEIDTAGQFDLSKDVSLFKYILVQASFRHQTHGLIYESDKLIYVKTIKGTNYEFILVTHTLDGVNKFVSFTFNNNKIVIDDNSIVITRVIGIY